MDGNRTVPLPAAAITALGTLRRVFATYPRNTAEDCMEIDLKVAAILRSLAEDIEGTDSHSALLNTAADIEGTVQMTRDRIDEDEANKRYAA